MTNIDRKKSPARAFLWLLIIPAQLVIDMLLIALGAALDGMIFSGSGAQGHGMPVFTVIMPVAVILLTVIAVTVSVVLVIVKYSSYKKKYSSGSADPMR